jgi:hypothetical protein
MPSVNEAVGTLVETVRHMVTEAISSNRLVPGEYRAYQWKLYNFTYDDSGVVVPRAEGDYVSLKSWFRAWEVLEPQIKAHHSFKEALDTLQQNYPALPLADWLDSFMKAIVSVFLPECGKPCKPEEIVERFLKDLAGGPVTYTAQVFLQGIVLRSQEIEVETGVCIRKPRKEDFEIPILSELAERPPRYPSAILEMRTVGARDRSPQLIQEQVERCVVLFRLFNVGSVKWMRYELSSDSIASQWLHGLLTSGDRNPARETYVIRTEDEPSLKQFWQTMGPSLPREIYGFQKRVSHITLAYDRYSDALLLNGILERRMASAVMGLEALFLMENQELSNRLSLRVSKLVSLISNQKPLEVRSMLKDAYEIRSTFAHGGHLSDDKKRRIEKKYDSTKALLTGLINHLRVSIIAAIMSGMKKDALVNLVDNALLDAQEQERLTRVMSGTAGLIS